VAEDTEPEAGFCKHGKKKTWVGAVWTFWTREKSLAPPRIQNSDLPARSTVAAPVTLSWPYDKINMNRN